jgi:hypothetical protein
MFWPEMSTIPSKLWILRCLETGKAWPNTVDVSGKPCKGFKTAEDALTFAKRHKIPLWDGKP